MDAAKSVIQKLFEEKKRLTAEKTQAMASRDATRESLTTHINTEKSLKLECKFNSIEAIETHIRALETKQATTSMSLQEEKKIIRKLRPSNRVRKLCKPCLT